MHQSETNNREKDSVSSTYPVCQDMDSGLTLYFEAITVIILGILGFPVFPDLHHLFDTLLICFHD